MFLDLHQTINDYVEEIREQTSNKDGNILALTWGECLTYLLFLEIIYERYENAYKRFLSISEQQNIMYSIHKNTTWKPNKKELRLMNSSRNLMVKLRLDIESFLIFTAVLLNKLTNFPQSYFKYSVLEKVKCGSHHKFWKTIKTNGNLVNLPSKEILMNVEWLQKNVIYFRDKLVIHTLEADQIDRQLIRGFSYHPERGGSIITSALYPDVNKEFKQYQSIGLQDIVDKLKEFIPQVIEFYKGNKEISILELEKI